MNLFKKLSSLEDKRPFYLWLGVFLINIGTYLVSIVVETYDGDDHVSDALTLIIPGYAWVFGISLLVSILPTWLSGTTLRWRNWLGFGIPVLLLPPVPYLAWHMYTCTGKMCNLYDDVLILVFGISAIAFTIFYLIGIFFRKWNPKFALSLVCLESFLVMGLIAILVCFSFLDSTFNSLAAGKGMEVNRGVQFCESIPSIVSRGNRCWFEIVKANPYVDVCSLVKNENSKWLCTIYRENVYRTTDNCEDENPQVSWVKRYDQADNTKLEQCWVTKSKKYPGLDICRASTYNWNKEKCTSFFKTLPQ